MNMRLLVGIGFPGCLLIRSVDFSGLIVWSRMAAVTQAVQPPERRGTKRYSVWDTVLEIDSDYVDIKTLGMGSYGVCCLLCSQ